MKETFIVRTEWMDAIFELSEAEQSIIFKNLFYFHSDQEPKINLNNLSVKLVWKFIEPNLKRNINSYDKRKGTSAENGKLGGRPLKINPLDKPNNLTQKPNNLNNPVSVIVSVSDSVNDSVPVNDIVKKKVNKIAAAEASGVYNSCKKIFLDFYLDKEKTAYYFQPKDGAKLKTLITKINFKIKEKNSGKREKPEATDKETIHGFEVFLSSAHSKGDNWIKDNFSLSTIDTKFNDIFKNLINGQSKSTRENKQQDIINFREANRAFLRNSQPENSN